MVLKVTIVMSFVYAIAFIVSEYIASLFVKKFGKSWWKLGLWFFLAVIAGCIVSIIIYSIFGVFINYETVIRQMVTLISASIIGSFVGIYLGISKQKFVENTATKIIDDPEKGNQLKSLSVDMGKGTEIFLECPKCDNSVKLKKIGTGGFVQNCEECGNADYYNDEKIRSIISKRKNSFEDTKMDQSTSSDIKICPYCAEEIKSAAMKCKHCGEWLNK